MVRKLYQAIASAVQARLNCIKSNPENVEWRDKHEERIIQLVKNNLPSGSGIDNGTTIDFVMSNGNKLVFLAGFHHMNDHGYYDGWTEHTITVRPSFDGVDITIGGRDRNDIKDYLAETYQYALTQTIDE